MSALKVFIADDEAPARERLKELLGDIAGEVRTELAGEAPNGLEALERVPSSGAQVLLLDIQMPGMGGLEVARHLSALEAGRPVAITAGPMSCDGAMFWNIPIPAWMTARGGRAAPGA